MPNQSNLPLALYSALAEQVYRRAFEVGAAGQPIQLPNDGDPTKEPVVTDTALLTGWSMVDPARSYRDTISIA